jgi:single-strand DNA-binding protein
MPAYAQISGHLGQDIELRQTNGGTPVVNVSLASNRFKKDAGGEKVSIADWFRVTIFGRDAEVLAQYAKKGSAVAFNGRLQTDSYFDREGVQRVTTFLIADSFEFMQRAKRDASEEAPKAGKRTEAVPKGDSGDESDDIPF